MGFWASAVNWLNNTPNHDGITPNENGPLDYSPGDPHGVEVESYEGEARSLSFPLPTPWSGYPSEWSTPNWGSSANGLNQLIDTAWACIDLNSSVLSAMPVYRTQSGQIVSPMSWMTNPDPDIYSSWQEFCKQLFWDYHLGEAFVLPWATRADGFPSKFRVIPPWLVNVELRGGRREYTFGREDVTDSILHIRYQSTTFDARGHGPLEVAGARMVTIGLLQRYAKTLVESGGTPHYWIGVEDRLNMKQASDLQAQWVATRARSIGEPAILSGGSKLNQTQAMNAKDMALLELDQFNEARIAVLLGVPPYLMALPSGGDSLTYTTTSQLTDHHDRSSLRTKAVAAMSALSGWALPRGQCVELNRDEYTRPGFKERAEAYKIMVEIGAMTGPEVRAMERLNGAPSAASLTGGEYANE